MGHLARMQTLPYHYLRGSGGKLIVTPFLTVCIMHQWHVCMIDMPI